MPHRRIVSLVPSLTETVCRLGACDRLVARTVYCVEPRGAVVRVPACGGTKNPDLERILGLAPDLALCCEEENKPEHREALARAGVTVHTVMPRTVDDVDALLADYGVLLDAAASAARARIDLAEAREELVARTPGAGRRTVVLIWKNPWMAVGGGNHIDGMMRELGLVNALGDRPGYPEVGLEELAGLGLDLILLPDEPWRFGGKDTAELVAAGAAPAAPCFDGKDLSWYGTWTAGGLRRMGALLEAAGQSSSDLR